MPSRRPSVTKSPSPKLIIDFDEIEQWGPELGRALTPHVSQDVISKIARSNPEFVEDARDLLFALTDREAVIDAALTWIKSGIVMAYHGTRLTAEDVQSVHARGLVPLKAIDRAARLERALSKHPDWVTKRNELPRVLENLGLRNMGGHREGQVHLTLSRAGLLCGFNHYLTHGAEFDQHAAQQLLGDDGEALLEKDGKKTLVQVRLTGICALDACHPYFSIEALRERGNVPNFVNECLKAWSFQLAHPQFKSKSLRADCGFVFRDAVPPDWIESVKILPD